MQPADIVRVLEQLPEKKLKLVDLAWKLAPDPKKSVDFALANKMSKELGDAMDEAHAHIEAGRRATSSLLNLM